MSSSLLAIRSQSEAGQAEQRRLADRKKSAVVLVHEFLIESGYVDAASRLNSEAAAVTTKYAAADNIDLMLIIAEFEAYYEMKFDKKPKLVRKLEADEKPPAAAGKGRGSSSTAGSTSSGSSKKPSSGGGSSSADKLPAVPGSSANNNNNANEDDNSSLGVQGVSATSIAKSRKTTNDSDTEEKFLRPPPQFGGDPEMKALAASISREIYQESPNVRFTDIVQLDEAKRLLCEAVQLPLRFPNIFTGILRPWRGILLHGPPGTGKTMLAKAVATECHTTFFNISASTLVSKWRGDSEKLVRVLFDVARYHAPSTIFLDEIDSILSSRTGDGQEHEASRRMKTELLIQMDGVKSASSILPSAGSRSEQLFVMAASNMPWDLDMAVLRRLEKRVLVPLPETEAREAMIRKHIQDRVSSDFDFKEVAANTVGFSGADIELLCREAAMMPVRRLMAKLEAIEFPSSSSSASTSQNKSGGSRQQQQQQQQVKLNQQFNSVDTDELIRSDPVSVQDMREALSRTRPSSDGNMAAYEKWQKEFGSI